MSTGYGYAGKRALLVSVRGKGESDAEYEDMIARTERLDHEAHTNGLDPVFIAVIGPDSSAPNAHWRRRFADSASNARSARTFAAVVTQSAIIRGVLNTIRWLQAKDRNSTSAYATFEAACAAAERFRGEALPELRGLLTKARSELEASAESVSRP